MNFKPFLHLHNNSKMFTISMAVNESFSFMNLIKALCDTFLKAKISFHEADNRKMHEMNLKHFNLSFNTNVDLK